MSSQWFRGIFENDSKQMEQHTSMLILFCFPVAALTFGGASRNTSWGWRGGLSLFLKRVVQLVGSKQTENSIVVGWYHYKTAPLNNINGFSNVAHDTVTMLTNEAAKGTVAVSLAPPSLILNCLCDRQGRFIYIVPFRHRAIQRARQRLISAQKDMWKHVKIAF